MPLRIALVTSNPLLVQTFIEDHERHRTLDLEIALAVRLHPSMRLADRLRDLRRTITRQARINQTSRLAQTVHYFAYRPIARTATAGNMASAVRSLSAGRPFLQVRSANDPAVAEAVRDANCSLVLIVGADVLSRRTLDGLPASIYNVHYSDPAFVRGLPPVFWEILDGRDSIDLTLHALTAALDAGPVVAQRPVPIVWQRTLQETIRRTRDATRPALSDLLADGLRRIRDGSPFQRTAPPGPLRTTPTISQLRTARRLCRERFRAKTRLTPP
jgi:methionyl-tRNA formyltransferase